MRIMAVCHDSVGIGHLRRTLAIAERAATALPSSRVLVVSGSLHASHFCLPERVDYIKLPSICKGPDYRYCAKSLGVSLNDAVAIRSAVLTATAASYRPDVFLIDKSPVGVNGEARVALQLVRDRSPNTRIIFGMRDIEDAPEQTIQDWRRGGHIETLRELVDEIWVYGDRESFDVVEAYHLPHDVAEKLRYVGYIVKSPCEHEPPQRRNDEKRLLVTVGGGTDGARLIEHYLGCPVERANGKAVFTTIVGGPDLPRARANEFRRRARTLPGVEFVDCVSCMSCAYRAADAVLCMGGYNTMVEVLRAGRPMIVYPRVEPRLEQYIRARRFAAMGLCEALDPNCMAGDAIRAVATRVLAGGFASPARVLNLDGLSQVTRRLAELETPIRDSVAVFV